MSEYFITTSNNIFLYIVCRKNNNLPDETTIWSWAYRQFQEAQLYSIKKPQKLSKKNTIGFNLDMINTIKEIEPLENSYWSVTKIPLSSEEISNGSGNLNLREILGTFIENTGGGEYIVQYFFVDDSDNPLYSIPSEPITVNFIL